MAAAMRRENCHRDFGFRRLPAAENPMSARVTRALANVALGVIWLSLALLLLAFVELLAVVASSF